MSYKDALDNELDIVEEEHKLIRKKVCGTANLQKVSVQQHKW